MAITKSGSIKMMNGAVGENTSVLEPFIVLGSEKSLKIQYYGNNGLLWRLTSSDFPTDLTEDKIFRVQVGESVTNEKKLHFFDSGDTTGNFYFQGNGTSLHGESAIDEPGKAIISGIIFRMTYSWDQHYWKVEAGIDLITYPVFIAYVILDNSIAGGLGKATSSLSTPVYTGEFIYPDPIRGDTYRVNSTVQSQLRYIDLPTSGSYIGPNLTVAGTGTATPPQFTWTLDNTTGVTCTTGVRPASNTLIRGPHSIDPIATNQVRATLSDWTFLPYQWQVDAVSPETHLYFYTINTPVDNENIIFEVDPTPGQGSYLLRIKTYKIGEWGTEYIGELNSYNNESEVLILQVKCRVQLGEYSLVEDGKPWNGGGTECVWRDLVNLVSITGNTRWFNSAAVWSTQDLSQYVTLANTDTKNYWAVKNLGIIATRSSTPLINSSVCAVTIDTTGSGYTTPPSVTIEGPGGIGRIATANATISGGKVTSIDIVDTGSYYSTVPEVLISSPPLGGKQAYATAHINATLKVIHGLRVTFSYGSYPPPATMSWANSYTFDFTIGNEPGFLYSDGSYYYKPPSTYDFIPKSIDLTVCNETNYHTDGYLRICPRIMYHDNSRNTNTDLTIANLTYSPPDPKYLRRMTILDTIYDEDYIVSPNSEIVRHAAFITDEAYTYCIKSQNLYYEKIMMSGRMTLKVEYVDANYMYMAQNIIIDLRGWDIKEDTTGMNENMMSVKESDGRSSNTLSQEITPQIGDRLLVSSSAIMTNYLTADTTRSNLHEILNACDKLNEYLANYAYIGDGNKYYQKMNYDHLNYSELLSHNLTPDYDTVLADYCILKNALNGYIAITGTASTPNVVWQLTLDNHAGIRNWKLTNSSSFGNVYYPTETTTYQYKNTTDVISIDDMDISICGAFDSNNKITAQWNSNNISQVTYYVNDILYETTKTTFDDAIGKNYIQYIRRNSIDIPLISPSGYAPRTKINFQLDKMDLTSATYTTIVITAAHNNISNGYIKFLNNFDKILSVYRDDIYQPMIDDDKLYIAIKGSLVEKIYSYRQYNDEGQIIPLNVDWSIYQSITPRTPLPSIYNGSTRVYFDGIPGTTIKTSASEVTVYYKNDIIVNPGITEYLSGSWLESMTLHIVDGVNTQEAYLDYLGSDSSVWNGIEVETIDGSFGGYTGSTSDQTYYRGMRSFSYATGGKNSWLTRPLSEYGNVSDISLFIRDYNYYIDKLVYLMLSHFINDIDYPQIIDKPHIRADLKWPITNTRLYPYNTRSVIYDSVTSIINGSSQYEVYNDKVPAYTSKGISTLELNANRNKVLRGVFNSDVDISDNTASAKLLFSFFIAHTTLSCGVAYTEDEYRNITNTSMQLPNQFTSFAGPGSFFWDISSNDKKIITLHDIDNKILDGSLYRNACKLISENSFGGSSSSTNTNNNQNCMPILRLLRSSSDYLNAMKADFYVKGINLTANDNNQYDYVSFLIERAETMTSDDIWNVIGSYDYISILDYIKIYIEKKYPALDERPNWSQYYLEL